jgi:integrase
LHFHDLRHTFATWLSERGYNPIIIMALTGHATIRMLKRYSNISDPVLCEVVESLTSEAKRKVGTKRMVQRGEKR